MKYIIFILTILFLMPIAAAADGAHPVVGQIQASGATADDEFVVLQNPTTQSVNLGSWSIQYKSASGTTYYKKNFVKGALIAANGTYVVCGKDYAGACDMKHSSFSLSSAGGNVFLVSNQTLITSADASTIVDQKTYAADVEAKPPQASDELSLPSQPEVSPQPTAPTPTVPKQPDTVLITINEFMPSPVEGEEWIEIYDGTGYAVDLDGWTLADGTGKNFVTLDGLIFPSGYKLIELTANHLNNGGDLIILRDANMHEVDSVAYGGWDDGLPTAPTGDDGVAVARIGDGRDTNDDGADFALTTTPTPSATNVITIPTMNDERLTTNATAASSSSTKISKTDTQWLADLLKTQNDDIAKLLKADNIIIINNLMINSGTFDPIKTATVTSNKTAATKTATKTTAAKTTTTTKTTVTKTANTAAGMVIVPAGIVGKDICVVREKNRSVEVRLPSDLKIFPIAGDIVKTSGTWSTAKTLTLPRLLVKTGAPVAITGHDAPPEPLDIPMSKASEHLGELVSTAGTIVEKQPTRLRIADGAASLLIKTNFEAAKGDKLSATGLVVKSGVDLFLTVIEPNALAIIKPPTLAAPSLAKKAMPYGLAALPAAILSTAVFFGKRLKKKGGGSK